MFNTNISNKVLGFLCILLALYIFKSQLREDMSGNVGSIVQLVAGNSEGGHYSVRPVRQRGEYFYNPSWSR